MDNIIAQHRIHQMQIDDFHILKTACIALPPKYLKAAQCSYNT